MEDFQLLRSFEHIVDFWSFPKILGSNATASVSPAHSKTFHQTLSKHNIAFTVLIDDLEKKFEIERSYQQIEDRSAMRSSISFNSYPRSNQISLYLDQLAKDYPDLVTVVTQAITDEYREIKYVRISNSTGRKGNKTIVIDAGIHAREWIAPSTALYVIQQLVEYATQNQDLLNLFEWIILPLVNPDGYEHSHTNVSYYY